MDEMKTSNEESLIDFEDEKPPNTAEKATQSPSLYQMYIREPRPWYQMWLVWGYLFFVSLVLSFYGYLTYKQYLEDNSNEQIETKRISIDGPGML